MVPLKIDYAQLTWRDEEPESTQFEDIYFSVDDGIAESQFVFVGTNHLPERFTKLASDQQFTIGETGFGTGLNFLCARHAWLKHAPTDATLHYISCEKFPLRPADLERALAPLEHTLDFKPAIESLLLQWPAALPGTHQLSFDGGRIQLYLQFGDAAEQIKQIDRPVNAWFLDGFAPSKNPDMWHDRLFEQLARKSDSETTLSTFTSAGIVKRGLQKVGFNIQKVPGYGRKRDMIRGTYSTEFQAEIDGKPWLTRPSKRSTSDISGQLTLIIGAGLAGATTARALANKGINVVIVEREAQPAKGGSGNPQGALYAKLPAVPTPASRIHANGLQFSTNWLKQAGLNDGHHAKLCGVLQLAANDKDRALKAKLLDAANYPFPWVQSVTAEEASRIAGTETEHDALFFPESGWASPPKLIHYLLQHDLIEQRLNQCVDSIEQCSDGWHMNGTSERFDHVVVCSAYEIKVIDRFAKLDLKPIRGQTTWCNSEGLPPLKTVVCGEGYISPPLENQYCFGSSFKVNDTSCDQKEDEHQHNLAILDNALPTLANQLRGQARTGRASQRASTRDYLPLVGGVCKTEAMLKQYERLNKDASTPFSDVAPWCEGLYVNVGHGSKGLITCPISAEIIAAQITDAPYPLERSLVDYLSPQRFIIRDLIRGQSRH